MIYDRSILGRAGKPQLKRDGPMFVLTRKTGEGIVFGATNEGTAIVIVTILSITEDIVEFSVESTAQIKIEKDVGIPPPMTPQ